MCFASKANAQSGFAPELAITNTTPQYVAPSFFKTQSTSPMLGCRMGGIADIALSGHLYFQTGLYFSVRGYTKNILADSAGVVYEHVTEKQEIHYLELPLFLMFKTGTQGHGRICFAAGASISFVVGGQVTTSDDGRSLNGNYYNNNYKNTLVPGRDVMRTDAGLNLSLGYEMPKGLFIRAFYYKGFNNLSTYGDESIRLSSWGIGMGYFVGKGRHDKPDEDLIVK